MLQRVVPLPTRLLLALIVSCPAGAMSAPTSAEMVLNGPGSSLVVMHPAHPERVYRGSRFDASSIVSSWVTAGTTIFAPWRWPHEPAHPEAASGPAEEFQTADDFAATEPGGLFLKIGVGLLVRPDTAAYAPNRPYAVADPGRWSVVGEADAVTFCHLLADNADSRMARRSYRYEKKLRLMDGGASFRVERELTNLGSAPLIARHYAHNFLRFNHRQAHTGYTLEYPIPLHPVSINRPALGNIDGTVIRLGPEPYAGRSFHTILLPTAPGAPLPDSVVVRHAQEPMALTIKVEAPVDRVIVFALENTVCPEFFTPIHLAAGESMRWSTEYHAHIIDPINTP